MENTETYYIDDYKVEGFLGDGGQASVYLCSKEDKYFASKIFKKGRK
jgi:serine/threonine-protein kinase RIO1